MTGLATILAFFAPLRLPAAFYGRWDDLVENARLW
jgi:hypothetical protein